MAILMGCIADDFTGGTDLAGMLVKSGMWTAQTVGLPEANLRFDDVDAVVIALKSHAAPIDEDSITGFFFPGICKDVPVPIKEGARSVN
jgi:hypothetical protein